MHITLTVIMVMTTALPAQWSNNGDDNYSRHGNKRWLFCAFVCRWSRLWRKLWLRNLSTKTAATSLLCAVSTLLSFSLDTHTHCLLLFPSLSCTHTHLLNSSAGDRVLLLCQGHCLTSLCLWLCCCISGKLIITVELMETNFRDMLYKTQAF